MNLLATAAVDTLAGGLRDVLAHGSDEVAEFTPGVLLSEARVEIVPLLLVTVLVVLYAAGVRRLRARGDHWGAWRPASFGLGVLAVVAATMSGLAAYDTVLFSAHMAQHMILTMLAPIFLSLGAPVTLALRTLPRRPRATLLTVLHSRVARVLAHPVLGFVVFVGSPFALYFSGVYEASLHSAVLHELVHVHFLAAGSVFFWPLLGLDPMPGRVSYPLRLLVLILAVPFHAFLGIAIMGTEGGLIAGDHYVTNGVPWADPADDQELGGALLWAAGDFVALLFVFVVLTQWMRAEERLGEREDRRLDRLEQLAAQRAGASDLDLS